MSEGEEAGHVILMLECRDSLLGPAIKASFMRRCLRCGRSIDEEMANTFFLIDMRRPASKIGDHVGPYTLEEITIDPATGLKMFKWIKRAKMREENKA